MKFDTLWRDPSTEAEWLHWRTTCLTSAAV